MKKDASHIQRIMVVSNTHWDREFRRSFEKTRRRLLDMMDITLDILEKDPDYHSFTMDGHTIMIDDYLEMRPEKRPVIERLVASGRLIIGPYFTLAEEFSISHEPLIRNLMFGRKAVKAYGGKPGTVAYTPSSWGQTGQLPQILADFGLTRMMFYRGISHHESDAEFIWAAPDGTQVMGSRFALYARYNWYYQVHRPVTKGSVFSKEFHWGAWDEVPVRFADGLAGEDLAFDLKDPAAPYDNSKLKEAIEQMVQREGAHFTTDIFLGMNGHDISVAYPHESKIIHDAQHQCAGKYQIEHTDLEHFWNELEKVLDRKSLPVLTGERRAYLKQGMWTFLFPATISARTYLKQQDFETTNRLVYSAEPMASLAMVVGATCPSRYLERGWRYLMTNHTHDANGGCAPDTVCRDMEYRYRKAMDIGDIVTEDAITHIAKNLAPGSLPADAVQFIVFNSLPVSRTAIVAADLEIPRCADTKSFSLESATGEKPPMQPISSEKSSSFVDSVWEVPTILESHRIKAYVLLSDLPAMGYRVYAVRPETREIRCPQTLVTGPDTMENEHLSVRVNGNGTITVTDKKNNAIYRDLNYLTDQGENGNAWRHGTPAFDRKLTSQGVSAQVAVTCSGPLVSEITAAYDFAVPADYGDGNHRSDQSVSIPVSVRYRLERHSPIVAVEVTLQNLAKDHWLRANFPTDLMTSETVADSHFDVVARPIALPDSSGWVEPAMGTHPLRTFVDMSDGKRGMALMPRGLFEYEAFEDSRKTVALTLIRACRIKLAVSEEKQTELPDPGVQCPGEHHFTYGLLFHGGSWKDADLLNQAAQFSVPVRAVIAGRGKGTLPHELSAFRVEGTGIHVTAVKPSEDGSGIVIRFFNALAQDVPVRIHCAEAPKNAWLCGMDEQEKSRLPITNKSVSVTAGPKKILTVKLAGGL